MRKRQTEISLTGLCVCWQHFPRGGCLCPVHPRRYSRAASSGRTLATVQARKRHSAGQLARHVHVLLLPDPSIPTHAQSLTRGAESCHILLVQGDRVRKAVREGSGASSVTVLDLEHSQTWPTQTQPSSTLRSFLKTSPTSSNLDIQSLTAPTFATMERLRPSAPVSRPWATASPKFRGSNPWFDTWQSTKDQVGISLSTCPRAFLGRQENRRCPASSRPTGFHSPFPMPRPWPCVWTRRRPRYVSFQTSRRGERQD